MFVQSFIFIAEDETTENILNDQSGRIISVPYWRLKIDVAYRLEELCSCKCSEYPSIQGSSYKYRQ